MYMYTINKWVRIYGVFMYIFSPFRGRFKQTATWHIVTPVLYLNIHIQSDYFITEPSIFLITSTNHNLNSQKLIYDVRLGLGILVDVAENPSESMLKTLRIFYTTFFNILFNT